MTAHLEKIDALRRANLSVDEIAEHLGLPQSVIRADLAKRPNGYLKTECQIAALYNGQRYNGQRYDYAPKHKISGT